MSNPQPLPQWLSLFQKVKNGFTETGYPFQSKRADDLSGNINDSVAFFAILDDCYCEIR